MHEKGGTVGDAVEMARMGKAQELRRNFKFVAILGFVSLLQATWESTLLANWNGLYNGGSGGVIWCTIAVWILMGCTIASLAEMASMAPTAGGQYHWVSEFAPPSLQGPLSYVVGWFCCLGWVAGVPSCCVQLAGVVQAMVAIEYPHASFYGNWQTTLSIFLFLFLTVGFNIFGARHLPLVEGLILFLHIFAFFAFLLTMWIIPGPNGHASASEVFTTFNNGGSWSSIGVSCLVGLTTPIWCFIGPDAGAHMSEEMKDASLQLPRAMMWAIIGNGVLGVVMLITFCFCITDLQALLNSNSDYPIIQVLYESTGSYAATCVLGSVLVILLFFTTVTTIASSSRQIWAFSRDEGFPFSNWIRYVPPSLEIPVNSLIVCLIVSLIISVINFGSDTTFTAITSVSNAALLFTYIISIGCLRLKRLRGEPLLPRRWSLGRFGGIINDISIAFLIVSFVFSFFPTSPYTPDADWWAEDANYAIFIFAFIALIAAVYYVCGGRRRYVAPVLLVKQE
ncbi:amino acid transporter [Teratosphaeria nubilosa]|uniref:Amino acid transporter n=1 Tax=Teratosphaeria nubilosa TaxID=161662 RepID=A0A6G1L7T1_9PEZI|nr:amino acid transporter [Teratosphaeria nubilosa]